MGREVRRVPADWRHPRNEQGNYIPLYEGADYAPRLAEWLEEAAQWSIGMTKDYATGGYRPKTTETGTYTEWAGGCPDAKDYAPAWSPEEADHLMMYEDTSEGTPISPAFKTPEELARWLADNGASAFGDMTATYEQWLSTCRRGSAISMVMGGGRMMSGVEAMA